MPNDVEKVRVVGAAVAKQEGKPYQQNLSRTQKLNTPNPHSSPGSRSACHNLGQCSRTNPGLTLTAYVKESCVKLQL